MGWICLNEPVLMATQVVLSENCNELSLLDRWRAFTPSQTWNISLSDVTGAQIVHKIVAMAGVEASQAPKISTKRGEI